LGNGGADRHHPFCISEVF